MQLRIYQRLNQLLLAIILSDVVMIVVGLLNLDKISADFWTYFIIAAVYNVICFIVFKMLENNWDKRKMEKMAIKGQIALANITEAKMLMTIKDSGGRHYALWQFNVNYWDQEMNRHEGIVIEKLNPAVKTIPLGTVYITNDEKKPLNRFIIQNVVIGHIPALIPIVASYEKNKALKIKYLNVYYRDGLIIETYKQSLNEAKKNENKQ